MTASYELTFVVPGKPQGKARARTVSKAGRVWSYTPAKTAQAEAAIRAAFRTVAGDDSLPTRGPVTMNIDAVFAPPKSMGRKTAAALIEASAPYTHRPDWDNVAKLVSDALTGIAWIDDAQVQGSVSKWYGDTAALIVHLTFEDGGSVE